MMPLKVIFELHVHTIKNTDYENAVDEGFSFFSYL